LEKKIVEITETLKLKNRDDWREWLKKNYNKKKEIWLIIYKKHTNKTTIFYNDAVEEALCFGWIDSTLKRIDKEKHILRFSPRNPNSVWSEHNIDRVKKMIKEGKMKKAGLEKFEYGIKQNLIAPKTNKNIKTPEDFLKELKNKNKAYKNYTSLAPSYKIMYIYWIISAKRKETRKRRIEKAVNLLSENKKLWEMY
jgi:uncharacterized protein YdeI (YjbR/CyaY-like superfamily)